MLRINIMSKFHIMRIPTLILYKLASNWPKGILKIYSGLGEDVTDDNYHLNYALKKQFKVMVRRGVKFDFWGKEVLEIGCGHGGISTHLALNGAKRVVGIDLNTHHLEIANQFKESIEQRFGITKGLNVGFEEQDAASLTYDNESFDIVLADNVFEHFMEPLAVLKESHRILKPGGRLVIPLFNSIYSKYGLHIKRGLRVPWANILFSEKTICEAVERMAQDDPQIYEAYPGLKETPFPVKVKDLRKYKDLNSMTHKWFLQMVQESSFQIESFRINPVGGTILRLPIKVLHKIPFLKYSILCDILSIYASAVLVKR